MKSIYKLMMIVGLLTTLSANQMSAASIGLSGNVSAILSIVVDPKGTPAGLDLTSAKTGVAIGDLKVRCNDKDGYAITIESANAKSSTTDKTKAVLKDSTTTEELVYTIYCDGAVVVLGGSTGAGTVEGAKTTGTGDTRVLTISYLSGENLAEGTYTDTITLTVAAK